MKQQTTRKAALSVTEAAEMLGVTRQTVYSQLLHREDFPMFKVGTRTLISTAGLEQWIASQVANGGAEK